MKKLLQYLLANIVTQPEKIGVEESTEGQNITFLISAHPDDIKIIIGKNGRTIKSIREIINIKAILSKQKVFLKIKE